MNALQWKGLFAESPECIAFRAARPDDSALEENQSAKNGVLQGVLQVVIAFSWVTCSMGAIAAAPLPNVPPPIAPPVSPASGTTPNSPAAASGTPLQSVPPPSPVPGASTGQLAGSAGLSATSGDTGSRPGAEPLLELDPKQISDYRAARAQVERATVQNGVPESLAATVRTIDLMDGTPKALTLVANYATVLMPVGENGAPWPIRLALSANGNIVEVRQPTGLTSSIVLTVKQPWMRTNLTLYLEGRSEPVILFLQTSADPIDGLDARVSLLVNGVAPGTPLPTVKNIAGVDAVLLDALHVNPGASWTRFAVEDQERLPFKLAAWTDASGKAAIVRLRGATLLSPAWDAQVSDADGAVHAYRYSNRPLTFLVSDPEGVTYRVRGAALTEALVNTSKRKLEVSRLNSQSLDAAAITPATNSRKKTEAVEQVHSAGGQRRQVEQDSVPETGPMAGMRDSDPGRADPSPSKNFVRVSAVAQGPLNAQSTATTPRDAHLNSVTATPPANSVYGASQLPPAVSTQRPLFLVGSDAVTRYDSAAPGSATIGGTHAGVDERRPGAAFATPSGSALQEPPAVTTDSDPIAQSTTVAQTGFRFAAHGASLRVNLERLAKEAGWSRLVWRAGDDYRLPEGLVFQGEDAFETIRQVLDRYPIRLEFYTLNQVAVVVPRKPRDGFINE